MRYNKNLNSPFKQKGFELEMENMHVMIDKERKKERKEGAEEIRMLEAVATLVTVEELVGETDIATHATNDLKIHHYCYSNFTKLKMKKEKKNLMR